MSSNDESPASERTTALFLRMRAGDASAATELLPLLYSELRALAQRQMGRERSDHTLQATALVHEVYVKLLAGAAPTFENRAHFFRSAAQAMRAVLVDHARAKHSEKRGGRRVRVELADDVASFDENASDILAMDEAVEHLEQRDPDLARVVELRFYAGLSNDEIASVLGVSSRTIERNWRTARAFLRLELDAEADEI